MKILGNKEDTKEVKEVTEAKEVAEVKETKEKKNKKEKKEKKERKKWSGKRIALTILAVFFGLIVIRVIVKLVIPDSVEVKQATVGELVQTVDVSGTIAAVETKQYFSAITAVAGETKFKKGDMVKKGDVIFAYDNDNLNRQIQLEEYKIQAAEGSYDKAITTNGRTLAKLSEARTNLATLAWQIPAYENYINDLETKIQNKKNALAMEGANLQISLIDWEDQRDSDEYENLRKLVQRNSYEQSNNAEIQGWNKELEVAKETLSYLKSLKSQMESQEDSASDSSMTSGGKAELEANTETVKIQSGNTLEEMQAALDGIKAEKDGIISSIDVVPGAEIAKGSKVVSIEYMDDVVVKVKVSKFDLERLQLGQTATIVTNGNTYEGEVSRISSIAEKTDAGAVMIDAEIKINNPDNRVVIGLEGKVSVNIGKEENAILVPTEAINYGSDGSFVMVIRDGKIVKQLVETGLADISNTQVTSGIEEGDNIILEITDEIFEGREVKPEIID